MDGKIQIKQKAKQILDQSISFREIVFIACLLLCFTSIISVPVALLLGIMVAQFIGNPYLHLNHRITQILLQYSVVGLGFGMDMHTAITAGREGFSFALLSILITLFLGFIVGKILNLDRKTSYLISTGTAICGGSAIAAIAPVIKAEEKHVTVSLGTIFILNALALFIFPAIGHFYNLSQHQFGIWSAIAIQDTSSVVGAAGKYGNEALQIATTVKLTRALWIIPLAFLSSYFFRSKGIGIKVPYFIGLFALAVVFNTYFPIPKIVGDSIAQISKSGLTLALFLIGSGLSRKVLTSVGLKPILQGIILWIVISLIGLWSVLSFL